MNVKLDSPRALGKRDKPVYQVTPVTVINFNHVAVAEIYYLSNPETGLHVRLPKFIDYQPRIKIGTVHNSSRTGRNYVDLASIYSQISQSLQNITGYFRY